MGKGGPKLAEATIKKIRGGIRAVIKQNKDLQAAVYALVKASKSKDKKARLASAISKVIVRNPLLQDAAKAVFNKMK